MYVYKYIYIYILIPTNIHLLNAHSVKKILFIFAFIRVDIPRFFKKSGNLFQIPGATYERLFCL